MPRNSTQLSISGVTGNSTSYPTCVPVTSGNSLAGPLTPCAAFGVNGRASSVPSGNRQNYGRNAIASLLPRFWQLTSCFWRGSVLLMFNWFKKPSPVPNGPDFSDIDSQAKAETRLQRGELEKLLLLPAEFGGAEDPRNIVYVPQGFTAIKSRVDNNIVKPLLAEKKVTTYQATPEYQGKSFVPISIRIVASNPGSFTTTINIWGNALTKST